MLRGGRVADQTIQDLTIQIIRNLNAKIHHDDRVYCSFIRTGDGTNIVFKK